MGARLSMNYGFTCTCFTKVELVVSHRFPTVVESILDQRYWYGAKIKSTHSIPITDVSFPECYGNDMVQLPIPRNGIGMGRTVRYQSWDICYGECMELYEKHSNPIETGQSSYGIGMGLSHIISIPDPMGNIWNFTKYVAIP